MDPCKALKLKEWRIHRRVLLTPLWFTLSIYAAILAGIIISLVKTGTVTINEAMPPITQLQANNFLWMANSVMAVLLGYVSLIAGFGLADSLLNDDYRKRCEILHLAQPIELFRTMGNKFFLLFIAAMGILLGLILVNSLIMSAYGSYLIGANIGFGLMGAIQGFMMVAIVYFFGVSLSWIWASFFRNKGILFLIIAVVAMEVMIPLVNHLFGLAIPALWDMLTRFLLITGGENCRGLDPMAATDIIGEAWSCLWHIDNLIRFGYGLLFFISSYWVYKRREIA